MATIHFSNITKKFDDFEAVKKFNLEVKDQEFVCLVGPSGCGKTTTLRMLAGLEEITDGTIEIEDKVINEVSPKDRNIAMVFQSYALYPHYTIYDNLAFGLRTRGKIKAKGINVGTIITFLMLLVWGALAGIYYGLSRLIGLIPGLSEQQNLIFIAGIIAAIFLLYAFPETKEDIRIGVLTNLAKSMKSIKEFLDHEEEIREKVKETAELLGIESQLWKKPKQLSGGQRQRVALGRAIIRKPKAFLMDEPLSNLDAKLRVQMRAELERLTKKLKITTLYVTHDQIEAMTLGNRIVVMNEGIANQVGTPAEVYQTPVNKFVAGFIGTPPMNFVSGKIQKESDGSLFFHSKAFTWKIYAEYTNALSAFEQKEVYFGIRPEHILLNPEETGGTQLEASVGVLEPIGSDTYVYIDFPGDAELIVKEEGITHRNIDENVRVSFMPSYVHFFDGETELRILRTGGLAQTHYRAELEKQGISEMSE